MYMWRAVNKDGEVPDVRAQKRRNTEAVPKLLRKLFKRHGFIPESIVPDDLLSCIAALLVLGALARHQPGHPRDYRRAENATRPVRRRERKLQLFDAQGRSFGRHALDLLVLERGTFVPLHQRRISEDDPYFHSISSGWSEALRRAFEELPGYSL